MSPLNIYRVNYFPEGSPAHFYKNQLKELREQRDFSSCDIVLVFNGYKDAIHSAVLSKYSPKMEKMSHAEALPLVLDMSAFPPNAVGKVIDWMYGLPLTFNEAELFGLLKVTSQMGVEFLHRQFEKTLHGMADQGRLVQALNLATHKETGIPKETIKMLLKVLSTRLSQPTEDLLQLKEHAVMAAVACPLHLKQRTPLINLALTWLRNNKASVEQVVEKISVLEMTVADLDAFKMTLTAAMRNPYLRRRLEVQERKNGLLGITTNDKGETAERSMSEASSAEESWSESKLGHIRIVRGGEVLANGRENRSANEKLLTDEGFTKWERTSRFSPSEVLHIQNLPDVFGETKPLQLKRSLSYTPSEIQSIENLPDMFAKITQGEAKKGRSFTRSELEELDVIPDIFQNPTKLPANLYTQSEIELSKNLPDVFDEVKTAHSFSGASMAEMLGGIPKNMHSSYFTMPQGDAPKSFYAF